MRILITGVSGFLGSRLGLDMRRHHDVLGTVRLSPAPAALSSEHVDLCDTATVEKVLRRFNPRIIVHAAAMSRVLVCERDPRQAFAVNVESTRQLADWAREHQTKLVFVSSDQVFSGKRGFYCESDAPDPLNVYGRTKLAAEQVVLAASPRNVIVRSNSIVGKSSGWGESFTDWVLGSLRKGASLSLFHDQYRSPIHVRVMVDAISAVCERDDLTGLLHVGGSDRMSRLQVGQVLARAYGLSESRFESASYRTHPHWEIMSEDTSYDVSRLRERLPSLFMKGLADYFAEDAAQTGVDL